MHLYKKKSSNPTMIQHNIHRQYSAHIHKYIWPRWNVYCVEWEK